MDITLLEGNGSSLFGGGSIQLEYDIWANNKSNNINLNHLVYAPLINKDVYSVRFVDELKVHPTYKTSDNRELHNVSEFTNSNISYYFSMFSKEFKRLVKENLIILTFPHLSNYRNLNEEISALKWYDNLLKRHKQVYKEKSNIIVVCYDYKKDVVLNNLGARWTELYQCVDTVWVNNKDNPLCEWLVNNPYNPVSEDRFFYECPQFIADSLDDSVFDEIKSKWTPAENMVKNQMYFAGRNLDWKGWKETRDIFWKTLVDNNINFNLDFNGFVNSDEDIVIEDRPLIEVGFRKTFDDKPRYFGAYSPEDIKELSSKPAYTLYSTNLPVTDNYFPEYAVIDAIRHGSVIIMQEPNWNGTDRDLRYFDVALTWNKDNINNIIKLGRLILDIQYTDMYDKFREGALRSMLKHFGANNKIREAINHKYREGEHNGPKKRV